jgi:hypothetical protein
MLGSVTLAVLAAASTAIASPLELIKRTSPGTGLDNGFFYSFWTDGQGSVTYNNGARGSYDVSVSPRTLHPLKSRTMLPFIIIIIIIIITTKKILLMHQKNNSGTT